MLDKLLSGDNDKTTRFRRYKNLLLRPHHQISHLHLRNNPYPEGHPRSCGELRTNVFQSGGRRSIREIIEQYVVYPEVSIHYEAEESEFVCDYLSEEKFLEELHREVPRPEDGIYKPVRQIVVPEEIFQKIQDCYPEILWEERPRIDIYCLPLDYFSHSPLIKGVTMIAKASGKAVWRAEGLDEKYVPTVKLELTPVYSDEFPFKDKLPQLLIHPEMPNENREELKRRILP